MAWLGLGALASGIGRYQIIHQSWNAGMHCVNMFAWDITLIDFLIYLWSPIDWLVLQRLLGGDATPAKVVEIKTDSLGNLPILHRDGAMVMYGPPSGTPEKKFEIVLNRPVSDNLNTCFRWVKRNQSSDIPFSHLFSVFFYIIIICK